LTKICPNLGGQPAFTQASPFHLLWGFSSVFFAQVKKQIRSIHGNPYGNVMLDNLPRSGLGLPTETGGSAATGGGGGNAIETCRFILARSGLGLPTETRGSAATGGGGGNAIATCRFILPRADLAYPPKPEGAQRLEAEVGTP
jgi:hypothetical protein